MNVKSLTISLVIAVATAAGASAQSLLDLQDLFGRQSQVRSQDSAVKVEYDIDFHYFFDYRSFGASDDIFLESGTINVARFSPSIVARFDQGRDATHRLAVGVDLTKDLGANPIATIDFSQDENDPKLRNTKLIKDIFFYYNYQKRIGSGRLGFYAGIHPRTVLEGSYTRAIFADDLIYYDPNIEGVTVSYSSPRLKAELTADMVANRGYDRKGNGMVSTAGSFKLLDWLDLGWSAAYTHASGSLLVPFNVDFALANPYVKLDFSKRTGLQELFAKGGAMLSYQFDHRIEEETPHFPMGAEFVLGFRNWNIGVEDTFYFGDNQMVYYSSSYSDNSYAAYYVDLLYKGDTFYFTRRRVPTWYNRFEAYWEPLSTGFVTARLSAVTHFITPAAEIGPYTGMQAKATLLFNLDAFRHPRETAPASRSRNTSRNRARTPRDSGGPLISL